MKGSRISEEQIIGVLREREAGAKEVCRRPAPGLPGDTENFNIFATVRIAAGFRTESAPSTYAARPEQHPRSQA